MTAKDSSRVRREFLDFFVERGHREVPSAPVVPSDDPTLLFTNAGMNQFKDVFLGTGKRDYVRAVDTQKCIRVSGKHNDLEEVGHDTYHHTFFEMLGNWSFGDYFKAEAIGWAWQLLTEVWGMRPEHLWVTVFEGDGRDGLPADEETERIWLERTGVDPTHVLRFGRKDNFWEMGDTGPCGPCTEIHVDRAAVLGERVDLSEGADPARGVNAGNERFVELWNNVFIEFNRLDDGALKPLPARHVDTGMGFERLLAVLQGKRSNYDTDLFTPLFHVVEELSGRRYGGTRAPEDVAFRVVADHARAVTAAFADGVLPSNTGRGYVMRRLVRRASRHGRQHLGLEEPFLWRVVPAVAEVLGGVFPEMRARREHVELLVREEEIAFGRTLDRGLARFGELVGRLAGGGRIPGDEAYELYATYGFPRDLVELMARERGLAVDEAGWERAREAHQEASRSEEGFRQLLTPEELEGLPPTVSTYHEAGASTTERETRLLLCARRAPATGTGAEGERRVVVALEESPFYPEGGGQVGDRGWIEAADGAFRIEVDDARRLGGVVVHLGRVLEGEPPPRAAPGAGPAVRARVDRERRDRTRKNHTATHLLHRALKDVLGPHVNQQGSYVGPDRLRFDFSHPKALTDEEIERIEEIVNARIAENARLVTTVEELAAAKARGVVALFGEKYEDRVRVVQVPGYSQELCGGTHVSAAGDIGAFVITSEAAIQAGVRRIEALTGPEAIRWVQAQRRTLREAARAARTAPAELPARVLQLQEQVRKARKEAEKAAAADVGGVLEQVRAALATKGGVRAGALAVDLDQAGLRDLASRAKGAEPDLALVLLGRDGERVPWIALAQGRARERGVDARELAPLVAEHVGGGGGGKPDLAQGQGKDPRGVAAAVAAVRSRLDSLLGDG